MTVEINYFVKRLNFVIKINDLGFYRNAQCFSFRFFYLKGTPDEFIKISSATASCRSYHSSRWLATYVRPSVRAVGTLDPARGIT